MRGRRKQQWAAVLLLMTIQPGSLVINGSAICQADSRGTGGNKGNECRRGRSSKGERGVKKERNQERGQG